MKKKTGWVEGAARGVAVALLAASVAACMPYSGNSRKVVDADIVSVTHKAGDALIRNLNSMLAMEKPIIAASFVNVDRLAESSSLGRMLSEQVSSRLAQLGYHVVEMKLRDTVFIKKEAGEFVLSRELKEISNSHDAQAVLAGTYAVGSDNVYVTVRLVRTTDSKIIASHDFALPMGRDTRTLVRTDEARRGYR